MNKFLWSLCVIGSSLILASCQSNNSSKSNNTIQSSLTPKPEAKTAADSLNGRWVPTNPAAKKVYYNEFNNGKFVSRSPDGSKTIAAGSYKTSANGDINMNWYSEARKANASAVCKKLSNSELQCSSGQSVFNLKRS